MIGFLRGDADVLVSTSIIESGIDIPQANTLIVDRADIFGLSQLYQIRGRVGRSRERAYAYLLYPSAAALTRGGRRPARARSRTTPSSAPASRSRCATSSCAAPATCSATSSPATSPRSASSSTCRCSTRRSRAMASTPTGDEELPEPVRLDVNVDAYVPADYIPYEQAKIDVHRRIAGARDVAELEELRAELADRFGDLPEPLENLITLQQARIKLGQAGAHGGHVPPGPARRHADRARLRARQADPRARSPARSTSRAGRSSRCACPTTPRSASPRSCGRPTCCSRCSARRPEPSRGAVETRRRYPRGAIMRRTLRSPGARRRFCARRHPRRLRRRPRQRRRRGRRHRDREGRLRPLAQRRREGRRSRRDGARRRRTSRSASRSQGRRAASRPRASRSTTDADSRSSASSSTSSCATRSWPPDLLRVDRGRGRGAGRQGHRRRGQEVVRRAEEAVVPEGRATTRSSSRTPARPRRTC